MKKFLLLVALIPTVLFAQNNGFVINGNISGLNDGPVKVTTTQQENTLIANGVSKNGTFTVNGVIPEPGLYYLVMGNEPPQYVYLENKPIKVSG